MIEFDSVSVHLGGTSVLTGLSLNVDAGETVVLLGRSGSGKSTTLRLVNRLLEPSSGSVRVHGIPTESWDPIELRRGIGYVIQEVGLFPHFTVAENVELVPRLLEWEVGRRTARVEELLRLVGLEPGEVRGRYPRELSGGQRQRVGVARALAADPPLLLCDEPFGAVDPITRRGLQREFRELSRRLGKTILFVTHDVREAVYLGDRIALLELGRIAFVGSVDGFRTSENPVVRAFRMEGDVDPETRGRAI
ncbi:MAG: ATP-binding cassette domain-containing protein [Gemmatimonadota bacterium]